MMLSLALATIAIALGIVGVVFALLSQHHLRKAERAMAEYEYWKSRQDERETTVRQKSTGALDG